MKHCRHDFTSHHTYIPCTLSSAHLSTAIVLTPFCPSSKGIAAKACTASHYFHEIRRKHWTAIIMTISSFWMLFSSSIHNINTVWSKNIKTNYRNLQRGNINLLQHTYICFTVLTSATNISKADNLWAAPGYCTRLFQQYPILCLSGCYYGTQNTHREEHLVRTEAVSRLKYRA
jgi:hypothetical protein